MKTADVRNENLTGTDILNGAVGSPDIGDGQVGSADIGDGQVGTSEVGDGSVSRADLAPDQRTTWALIAGDGTIVQQSGSVSLVSATSGVYIVNMGVDLSGRAVMTSAKFPQAGPIPSPSTNGFVSSAVCGAGVPSATGEQVTCTPGSANNTNHVLIQTKSEGLVGASDPRPFYIAVLPK